MTTITTTDDLDAASCVLRRLQTVTEAERATLYAHMDKGESTRHVLTYALATTDAELQTLRELLEAELEKRRGGSA